MDAKEKMDEKKDSCKTMKSRISYFFIILITPIIIFSLGVVPLLFWLIFLFLIITYNIVIYLLIAPLIFILSIFILIVSEMFITGFFVKLFRIRYQEGTYEYSYNNYNTIKWILICQLYTPIRKILEIFPMGEMKIAYYRLMGMKIGKNSLVGGVIKDPCMTEIGDNVTIGEYAIIYAHMHNKTENTISIKPVKIGNNCIVGAGAIIMPGVIMEDNSILAAAGVALKNNVLKKNRIYGGNPAKEIKKIRKK